MANSLDRDFVSAARLQAFSDAVYAIVATILVLPVRKVELEENETLKHYLSTNSSQFILYFIAFLIVSTIWKSHVTLFRVIAHVDDVIVWLNLLSLMFATLLPFTCRLEGMYGRYMLPVVLNCTLLVIIQLIEIAMVFYAFANKELLQEDYQQLTPELLREHKEFILFSNGIPPVFFVLAAVSSSVNLLVAWCLMSVVIILPCVTRLLLIILHRCQHICGGNENYLVLIDRTVNKERKECFSDGVYSIVATLLVLDITTEHFPTQIKDGRFDHTIFAMWPEFLVYIAAFIVVALLWFVHHSLFHHIKQLSQLMALCHGMSLAFTGAMPFVSSLLMKFGQSKTDTDLKVAVQVSAIIIFMAAFMEFIVFVVALWNSTAWLQQDILPNTAPVSHNYLLAKSLLIPLLSAVSYYSTFSTNFVAYLVHHLCIFVAPFLFILLKLVFNHWRRNVPMSPITINPESEEVWSARLHSFYKRRPKKTGTPLFDTIATGFHP